jgi:hypothetical protein
LAVRYVIAVLLFAALVSSASAAKPAQPSYVVQAEKNYHQARRAVEAAESDLKRLKRKETRDARRAMIITGNGSSLPVYGESSAPPFKIWAFCASRNAER